MRPSAPQLAAMVLAESEGYVRPASPTHARRCATTTGRLAATVKACQARGWLRPVAGGRFVLTDAGREHVPSRPRPRFDGTEWATF